MDEKAAVHNGFPDDYIQLLEANGTASDKKYILKEVE